jgi:hypothetical protein
MRSTYTSRAARVYAARDSHMRTCRKRATSFSTNPDGSITAISPAHDAGTVDVRVTTTAGTSAGSAGDRFDYL